MYNKLRILQVDAFAETAFKGNPAGIVPEADGMEDALMQSIANEMNLSETAFVQDSNIADFRIRFFTPREEVALCGHASIGAVFALAEEGRIPIGKDLTTVQLETNVGVLPVDINSKAGKAKKVLLTQDNPEFRECRASVKDISDILNIPVEQLRDARCPIGISYTGLWHLLVPIKDLAVIRDIRPDMGRLETLNIELGVDTTHVFTFQTENSDIDVHARDFAPVGGINEDPGTGTANGALGAFLVKNKVIELTNNQVEITIEQGCELGRDSKIEVEILAGANSTMRVKVGGQAVISLEGFLHF